MKTKLIWIFLLSFYCISSFANNTIIFGEKKIILPDYEGYHFVGDKESKQFKVFSELFSSANKEQIQAFYVIAKEKEQVASGLPQIIIYATYQNKPESLTQAAWDSAKNALIEDYKSKPDNVVEKKDGKVKTVIKNDVVAEPSYVLVVRTIEHANINDQKPEGVITDLTNHIYVNGEIIIVVMTIIGKTAINETQLKNVEAIAKAKALQLIELNSSKK
ncbi:hypothetical protein [Candidatus Berkiella aquae]|uniref:Uncharacterized protein n=1 Tax=Candidatus Berkiella aquae TaxID=295108 RepID=A0A0Q9YY47_9GAMM|nr:hypothetical protein [Candidatus Berkiella aquae]MCS5711251.1 hypothetical protein [Candidatus Berkiella aquae]